MLERIPIVQHTAMPAACQSPTPSTTKNDTIAARFGAEVCAAGHTSVPNLVRRYWSRLGATASDYLCYETIVEFQRGDAPPQVYVPLLAAALGQPTPAGERRVRQHTAHLVALGLLQVTYTGRANVYDFSPLYRRVAELSAATPLHAVSPAVPAPTTAAPPEAPVRAAENPRSDRQDSPPYEDVPTSRLVSIPPHPPSTAMLPTPTVSSDEASAVAALVAEIGAELDDMAPRSSRTRAEALRQAHALDAATFAALADQARRVVDRRRRKGPPLRRAMAYWFDVLAALLTDAGGASDDEAEAESTDQRGLSLPSGPRAVRTRERDKELSAAGADASPTPASPPADLPAQQAPEDIVPAAGETQLADAGPGGELWRCVAAELATVMTSENYSQWIVPTTAELADDPTGAGSPVLRVTVPSAFHREWLERKLRCRVEHALQRVEGGVRTTVIFVAAVS